MILNGAGAPVVHAVSWQLHSAWTASSVLPNVASAIRLSCSVPSKKASVQITTLVQPVVPEDFDKSTARADQTGQMERTCSKKRRGSAKLPPTQCCLRMATISSPAASPPVMLEMCKTGPGGNKCCRTTSRGGQTARLRHQTIVAVKQTSRTMECLVPA